MTLIVARITDRLLGRISLLADTMITDFRGDEAANRQVLSRPGQKVAIIDDNYVVGFAGDNPNTALKEVVEMRRSSPRESELLSRLAQFTGASATLSRGFVVASRYPEPRLWTVVNGEVDDRTTIGQAYVGNTAAYNAYRTYAQQWGSDQTDEFRLVSSMQTVIMLNDIPSVGGYVTRVSGDSHHPFRFQGDPGYVAPWYLEAKIESTPNGGRLLANTPDGGDSTAHTRLAIGGKSPTFSALVHVVPQSGTAWMHTHEEPWNDPVKLPALSPEMVRDAAGRYGQHIEMPLPHIARMVWSKNS